ncbi:MAG: alpha/beta hydrolase [Thermoplasmata archaeon]|nr:MAG: alpha/beta hydrolase [Thermoplasmata archaeon]
MLLIHGMWGSASQWNEFLKYFKACNIKARAIEYKKNERASFMDYVKEVAEVAENEVIVGHSMGGLIVQKVAEITKIKAGIAIGSAPPHGIKFGSFSLTLSSMRYLPKILMKKPFIPSYGFVRKYLLNCINEERAREIYSSLLPESPKAAYEVFMGKVKVDERKVNSPMLFIALKDDRVAPVELEERIASKYKAKLAVLNGCHWIFDSPHEIAEQIIKFASEIL